MSSFTSNNYDHETMTAVGWLDSATIPYFLYLKTSKNSI